MARMMFENLEAIVSNTLTDSIQMIDIDELYESKDNFFEINRIEEFADTILGQGGIKDNLLVRPMETGGYEIISGHRRKAAVQHLLDRGENISRYLPCLVQDYDDENMKMLDIVLMNISARQISDAEVWRSYEIIDKILKNKKIAGERFGRVRETLADLLGVSPAQIGKMQNVGKNAIPEVIKAVESGKVSISTANEIAKLDENVQECLVQQSDLSSVSPKALKRIQVKKVDTNINSLKTGNDNEELSKPDAEESEADIDISLWETDSDEEASEPDEEESEADIDTSLWETDGDEEAAEPDAEDSKADASSRFAAFVHANYYELEAIFEAYIGLTEDEEEAELLKDFLPLLYEVKETVRSKVRFGF